MGISREAIKRDARLAMQRAQPKPIWVALVYLLVVWVLQLLSSRIMGWAELQENLLNAYRAGWPPERLFDIYRVGPPNVGWVALILNTAISAIILIVDVGFSFYLLQVSRMRRAGFESLLDGFGIFFKVLWLNILQGLFIFLWTMLFIIPGIIAAYRYRQAIYIMLDNPDYSALRCIRESKRLMRGRKGELFILDLSFIGWALLCVVPIVSVWVKPYMGLTFANFYNALLRAQNPGGGFGGTDFSGQYGESDGKPPWEY